MRAGNEHLFHIVLILGLMRGNAHAAAVLRLIFGNGQTLDISRVRQGNDDVLSIDQIRVLDIAVIDGNLRAAGRRVTPLDFGEVGTP